MIKVLLHRLASICLLAAALWAGNAYLEVPLSVKAASQSAPVARRESKDFHAAHRAKVTEQGGARFCQVCHGRDNVPHSRDPVDRAFLNLHTIVLDCGVCHLVGRDLSVRRFREGVPVTAEGLSHGLGGRLYAARKVKGKWEAVVSPGPGVLLRTEGEECKACHRRGSPMLAGEGVYDAYRRIVLEDLAILARIRRSPK